MDSAHDCAGKCIPLEPIRIHVLIPDAPSPPKLSLFSCFSSPLSFMYQVNKVSGDSHVRLAYFETAKEAQGFIERHHGDFEYCRVSVPTKHIELTNEDGCVTLTAGATVKQVSRSGTYWIK